MPRPLRRRPKRVLTALALTPLLLTCAALAHPAWAAPPAQQADTRQPAEAPVPAAVQALRTAHAAAAGVPARAVAAERARAVVGSRLQTGGTLAPGDALRSPSGAYLLLMGTDGNLVVQKAPNRLDPQPHLLGTLASGPAGSRLVLQADGNLVLYDTRNVAHFATKTYQNDPEQLLVQNDLNIVLYRSTTATALWNRQEGYDGVLLPGDTLLPGETLTADDGGSRLTMQADGNLVLYSGTRALYATGTASTGAALLMQYDGNVVIYSTTGAAVFTTGTSAPAGGSGFVWLEASALRVSEVDPGLPLAAVVAWGSAWGNSTLQPGQVLLPGDRLTASSSVLVMQTDGNLVLYVAGRPVFNTRTSNTEAFMLMQPDGNPVIYGYHGMDVVPLFSTRTAGHPGSRLVVQADGNLVVYSPQDRPLFSTR